MTDQPRREGDPGGMRQGVETTCSECGAPTRDFEEYADDTLCDDCMDAVVAGSQSRSTT